MKRIILVTAILSISALSAQVKEINGKEDLDKQIEDNSYVVVKFYRPGCPACRRIEHAYKKISDNVNKGRKNKITFLAINTNDNKPVYKAWGVTGVPTIFFIKDGKKTKTHREGPFDKTFPNQVREHFPEA